MIAQHPRKSVKWPNMDEYSLETRPQGGKVEGWSCSTESVHNHSEIEDWVFIHLHNVQEMEGKTVALTLLQLSCIIVV